MTLQTIQTTGPVALATHLPNLPSGGGSGLAGKGIFGAAPQWSDGSDSSYSDMGVSGTGADYAFATFPTVSTNPADILSATLNVRWSSPTSINPKLNFRLLVAGDTAGTTLVGDADPAVVGPPPAAGAIVSLTGIPLDYSDPINQVMAQSGLAVYIWPSVANNRIRVYEVSITADIKSSAPPTHKRQRRRSQLTNPSYDGVGIGANIDYRSRANIFLGLG